MIPTRTSFSYRKQGKQIMIKSAKEVRTQMMQTESYQTAVEQAVGYVVNSIESAKSMGLTHTCFSVRPAYEQEVKRMFLDQGYSFKPTGYCGGVWQLSEDICW
jgi:hypothetical protein